MAKSDRDSEAWLKFLSIVESIATWVVNIGVVVFVLVLIYEGYLGYSLATFSGGQEADLGKAMANLRTAGSLLQLSAFVTALILVLRQKTETQELYGILSVIGLLLWFGAPYGLHYLAGASAPREGVERLAGDAARTGQLLLGVLIIPLLSHTWRAVRTRPIKRESDEYEKSAKLSREGSSAKKKGKPNVLSPCWHLPYCRDYLLDVCPAYKARRRCWKFGGGCFCDQRMIESMMRGLARRERGQQEQYMRAEIDARTGVLTHRAKKPPCKKCFIYLEHEKLKFDVIAPLVYVVTTTLVYFAYKPILMPGWYNFQVFLARTWQQLAFRDVVDVAQVAAEIQEVAGIQVAGYIFTVVIAMFVLLGLLKLAETWCFKWKL